MKKIIFALCLGLVGAAFFSACNEIPVPTDNTTPVESVSITSNALTLYVNDTQEIKFNYSPSGANTALIKWVSADEAIATVSGGYVTGKGVGSTKITAQKVDTEGKATDLASVNVTVDARQVSKLTVTSSLKIFKNKTGVVEVSYEPDNATFRSFVFSSSDEKVATVAEDGTVTAVAPGKATITVTAKDKGAKSATCEVEVLDVDDIDMWASNAAGSVDIVGGDNPDIAAAEGHFLSYSKGKVSWTENTTGTMRSDTLVIPATTSKIAVTQFGPDVFKGTWDFRTQRFSNNAAVTTAAADVTMEITIGDPLVGETLKDHDGTSYTNNLGVKGLYLDAVADAVAVIDYENKSVKFGIFLDERKAQPVKNGNDTYPYVCFIPECGTTWNASSMASPWNFVPKPISDTQNYQWLWFDVKEDLKTLQYDHPYKQNLIGKDGSNGTTIIGITCAVAKNATPTADDIFGTYNVIYQANPGKANNVGGFMLTKK